MYPGYHHNGFVEIHAVGHIMMYELPHSHCGDNQEGTCFHDCIYITPILLL